ncbi:MAG: membrane protein insertion efficiency factor YidD [Candidatus Magasanikbacteria bacterium]|nr:membrane protein insertion efficiency factor YidD [Candidatus Magasanikbacteria bacterium]
MIRAPWLALIRIYQKTLSPDHSWRRARYPGGFCRFYPTCSEYSYQIIQKRGLILGLPPVIWRVLRCNPWSQGGVDLPK